MFQNNQHQPSSVNFQTLFHQSMLHSNSISSTDDMTLDSLEDFIEQEGDFMIITNQKTKKTPQNFYSLFIGKEKLDLIEKDPQHSNETIFYFNDQKIMFNQKEVDQTFLQEFNRKVEKILADLKAGKAKAFDKV